MGALTALAIIGVVTAFLIRVLGAFPADGAPADIVSGASIDEAYSAESIDQATQLFSNNYMSVVDEIASFQTDPDLRRAETRRHEMASFGGFLADALRAFGAMMQGGLEELAVQPGGQLEALPLQEVATSSQVMW